MAVEFAILLPLLLVLLFGIIEFSVLLYDKAMITNASREGARLGIVYDPDPDTGFMHPPPEDITATVTAYCQDHLITFGDSSQLDTQINQGDDRGAPRAVTVSYQYDFLVLPNFVGDLAGNINLSARSIMRME